MTVVPAIHVQVKHCTVTLLDADTSGRIKARGPALSVLG